MGLGSEMVFAQNDGRAVKQLIADPGFYLSLARWSPDEKNIAYIKIPDSQTPFTVGALWVMSADGSASRKLADADAGHGFAPAWSPDGTQLAFVKRENPNNAEADQSADALVSNLYLVNAQTGTMLPLTKFADARVGSPIWSPDGNQIAFTVVMNDKMSVMLVDPASGETQQVLTGAACCPAWIQK
jgi:Tol biopolymer transport system component